LQYAEEELDRAPPGLLPVREPCPPSQRSLLTSPTRRKDYAFCLNKSSGNSSTLFLCRGFCPRVVSTLAHARASSEAAHRLIIYAEGSGNAPAWAFLLLPIFLAVIFQKTHLSFMTPCTVTLKKVRKHTICFHRARTKPKGLMQLDRPSSRQSAQFSLPRLTLPKQPAPGDQVVGTCSNEPAAYYSTVTFSPSLLDNTLHVVLPFMRLNSSAATVSPT